MESYILAIDQSTSGTKALIVDNSGVVLARSSLEHRQLYMKPGWVEHDPLEIYFNVEKCAEAVLEAAGVAAQQVAALTITNQRETAVMWDRLTGVPVYNAVVWQCQRTAGRCAQYKSEGHEAAVTAATGLMLDPYFSASKWGWILENIPEARAKLEEGTLLAGTIDSWLIWRLTGGTAHATDYTNASRTSLFNIHSLSWDKDMCALFGVPSSLLPEVKYSDDIFGWTDQAGWLGASVPVTGVIGDSQGALFGNLCLDKGMAKATYGTGTSVLMNVGESLASAAGSGLVQTIAWGMNGTITYALEAIIRTSGDSLKWLRDSLGLFGSFEEMDCLLAETSDSEGVYLVPAFVGLGAPYWQPDARAAITGMNRGTGKAHIIRAAVESIAYQVYDAVELLQSVSGVSLEELRADGGAAENADLMQFQADLLGRRVVRAGAPELSALGSVYLGGLAVGVWGSAEELAVRTGQSRITYGPSMNEAVKAEKLAGWKRAVGSLLQSG